MPSLATGRKMMTQPRANRATGFTLVEIIVVIFILALASGMILLRVSSKPPGQLSLQFAKTLKAYLVVVQEQAMLRPSVLGLSLAENGYQVLGYKPDSDAPWYSMTEVSNFWAPKSVSGNVRLSLTVDAKSVSIPQRLYASNPPQIFFMPSGEMTPFVLSIGDSEAGYRYQLIGNFAGALQLIEVSDHGQ